MNREKFKEAMWMFSTADTDGRADIALDAIFDALQPGGPCSEAPSTDEGREELIEWLQERISHYEWNALAGTHDAQPFREEYFKHKSEALQEVLDHLQKSPEPETKA